MNNEENRIENNNVVLAGEVAVAPVFSHEIYGEGFFMVNINVPRTSGIIDAVPVMISERLCNIDSIKVGNLYEVRGKFRSYNKHEERKNRLLLSVFATEIIELDESDFVGVNDVTIDGYICKEPVYRKTPLGREIADLLVAVNRPFGKSDYIPCIAWGRNARYSATFEIGKRVRLSGRIQSREYVKKTECEESETRVAYELSVNKITVFE